MYEKDAQSGLCWIDFKGKTPGIAGASLNPAFAKVPHSSRFQCKKDLT
jgi:hypothetical protein